MTTAPIGRRLAVLLRRRGEHRPKIRHAGFVLPGKVVAAVVILAFALHHPDSTVESVIINLSTEVIGIALTVLILDRLADRRALLVEAGRIAWRALHDVDHAVWVWQGGARAFDLDELLALLRQVNEEDPVPPFTQNLLLRLGSMAEGTLRLQADTVRVNKNLAAGLVATSALAALRDSDHPLGSKEIASCLLAAIPELAKVVPAGELSSIQVGAQLRRDAAPAAQARRHFGWESDPGAGDTPRDRKIQPE